MKKKAKFLKNLGLLFYIMAVVMIIAKLTLSNESMILQSILSGKSDIYYNKPAIFYAAILIVNILFQVMMCVGAGAALRALGFLLENRDAHEIEEK